jgi:hypothetical protein
MASVVLGLQPDPHLGLGAQNPLKFKGKSSRDAPLAIDDLIDLSVSATDLLG